MRLYDVPALAPLLHVYGAASTMTKILARELVTFGIIVNALRKA